MVTALRLRLMAIPFVGIAVAKNKKVKMESPYEKELVDYFMFKLRMHLKSLKLASRRAIKRETLKYAKRHDKKWLTDFEGTISSAYKNKS